jgi:hypothetical protein
MEDALCSIAGAALILSFLSCDTGGQSSLCCICSVFEAQLFWGCETLAQGAYIKGTAFYLLFLLSFILSLHFPLTRASFRGRIKCWRKKERHSSLTGSACLFHCSGRLPPNLWSQGLCTPGFPSPWGNVGEVTVFTWSVSWMLTAYNTIGTFFVMEVTGRSTDLFVHGIT